MRPLPPSHTRRPRGPSPAPWVLLALALAPGCHRRDHARSVPPDAHAPPNTPPPNTPPNAPALPMPDAVLRDAAFRQRVEALAREHNVWWGGAVGVAAIWSPPPAAYTDLIEHATPEQIVALVGHPEPIVRGFVTRRIASGLPVQFLRSLAPLLTDATVVQQLPGGCSPAPYPVALSQLTVRELCAAGYTRPEALAWLREIAVDSSVPGPSRGEALNCVRRPSLPR